MDDIINENVKKPNEIAKEARDTAKEWLERDGWKHIPENKNKGRINYLIATKGDKKKVFIVKGTTVPKDNFGAVTLTTFKVIFEYNKNCGFLLVNITNKEVKSFKLKKILQHMFIPPFKIDFIINEGSKTRNDGKGVILNDIRKLIKYYEKIKKQSIK